MHSASIWIAFLLSSFVACQEGYICKRLVTDQHRCEIYNYNHPLCKKWDRSNCPPPHINRDYGPCVTYTCVREPFYDVVKGEQGNVQVEEKWQPPPTRPKTTVPTKELREGQAPSTISSSSVESLQQQIAALRRVNLGDLVYHMQAKYIFLFIYFFRNFSASHPGDVNCSATFRNSVNYTYQPSPDLPFILWGQVKLKISTATVLVPQLLNWSNSF